MLNANQESLFRAIIIQNTSTSWYQKEMRKVLEQIRQIEENVELSNPITEHLYYRLQGQLHYLIGKGLFEKKSLIRFRYQIDKFFKR